MKRSASPIRINLIDASDSDSDSLSPKSERIDYSGTFEDDFPESPNAQTYLEWMNHLDLADAEEAAKSANILFSISTAESSSDSESDSFISNPPTPESDPTFSEILDESSESEDEPPYILTISLQARNNIKAYVDHVKRYAAYDDSIVNRLDRHLHRRRMLVAPDNSRRFMPNI